MLDVRCFLRIPCHLILWPSFTTPTRILIIPDYAKDLTEVIARAQAAGITQIISIGTDLESSARAIKLAERFEGVFAAVGWHPSNAHEAPDDIRDPLRELVKHPKVVAIGEIGLDYHHLPGGKTGGSLPTTTRATNKSRLRFSGNNWKSPLKPD